MPFVHPGFTEKSSFRSPSFSVSLRPKYMSAIIDIMKLFQWKSVYYLYDTDDGLIKLQNIFNAMNTESYTFNLKAIKKISSGEDGHQFLKVFEMRAKETLKHVVMDCTGAMARAVIAAHVKDIYMGRRNFHFLLTNLIMDDFYGVPIAEFGAVNVTGFRILQRNTPVFRHFYGQWKNLDSLEWPGAGSRRVSADAALMFDSTKVLLDSYQRILEENRDTFKNNLRSGKVYNNGSEGINCAGSNQEAWEHGGHIVRHLKATDIEGLSGRIQFDGDGNRVNFTIDVVQTTMNSEMTKIAHWTPTGGLTLVPAKYSRVVPDDKNIENKTYIVTTIEEEPFLMTRKADDGIVLKGNDRYEGYCKDLAELISNHLKIKYVLKLVNDSKYGGIDAMSNSGWNGMVGELIRQEADMSIAPLTITSARERVIDFTKPFMSLGISIMIKKPVKKNPGIFSFMNPLSKEIWCFIILSYIAVAVVLFLVSRFSPNECRLEPGPQGELLVANDFSLYNSLWFALGAIMQQGVDLCPRSYAGRIVGSVWWFFTLIIISSYTANLAAFLTVERMVTPINSADDLAKQTEVEYGTLRDSSTQEFFKRSKINVYARMWEFMNSKPQVFVNTYKEGIQRVKNSRGKYAFLMESTQNDYINERKPCDTMKVGRNMDAKGFGVATPLGSPLRVPLNLAVLALTENGDLTKLENKWWYDRSECKSKDTKDNSQSSLTLYNVAGCFYILIAGLILGMLVGLAEFYWRARQEAHKAKIPIWEAMSTNVTAAIVGDPFIRHRRQRLISDSI
ncbi:Glutamate receptor 1 [Halotydeus destructor]|nr:Glutamate receptor 1 [Halotydeus destructor]